MVGLFGGTQKTTTNEKFDTGPSSWQKGYLDQAFGEAKNIYGQSAGSPYYQGDTYAGLDDNTKASLDRLKSYASGTALDGAGRISSIGSSMASTGSSQAMDLLDKFTSLAGENATTAHIKAASAYAETPYTTGMIDAKTGKASGRD